MTDDEQEPVSVAGTLSTGSVETVQFALDGSRYEIDLDPPRAAALRTLLARYVAAARTARRTAGRSALRGAEAGPGGGAG